MSSKLHLIKGVGIVDKRTAIPCQDKMLLSKFMTTNKKLVHQTPVLEYFDANLRDFSHDMSLYMGNTSISEDDTSKMELYTSEEMSQFLSLIHDGRYKEQMTSKLIHDYCISNDCHLNEMSFSNRIANSFQVGNIADPTAYYKDYILSHLAFLGNICSILVVFIHASMFITRVLTAFCWWRSPHRASNEIKSLFIPNPILRMQQPPNALAPAPLKYETEMQEMPFQPSRFARPFDSKATESIRGWEELQTKLLPKHQE